MQLKNARSLALNALLKVEDGQKVSSVIDELLNKNRLNDADRRLFTELVYGISRWRGQIDWIIDKHIRYKPDRVSLNILRLGVYQLIYLDKIPSYAAINESVELAKSRKKSPKFVNAVLRAVQRAGRSRRLLRQKARQIFNQQSAICLELPELEDEPVKHLSVNCSFPEWLIKRWLNQYGLDWTVAFCEASNQIAPTSIRTNTLKTDRAQLIKTLEEEKIKAEESRFAPEGIRLLDNPNLVELFAYAQGLFQVQDESAMLVSHILDPKPDEVIFDVCAGPGGKTTHIAQLMRNRGQIFAFDILQSKLALIVQNCARLGISIVKTSITDASKKEVLPRAVADRLLIDAPCSGFGTLRRHPDIRWNKSRESIFELSELQLKIISSSSKSLKPGGIMVYSTCTVEPEENEKVVEKFLAMNSEFTIEPVDKFLPNKIDNLTTERGYLRTYPHLHDVDGTFVARLRKIS